MLRQRFCVAPMVQHDGRCPDRSAIA
jgi:hypothetical protein